MAHYIMCLKDGERRYYLEWSDIVDAPATLGLSREEFETYYREQYGDRQELDGRMSLESRLARAEKTGISAMDGATLAGQLACNRAGPDGIRLSQEEIIDWYCKRRVNPWGPYPLE